VVSYESVKGKEQKLRKGWPTRQIPGTNAGGEEGGGIPVLTAGVFPDNYYSDYFNMHMAQCCGTGGNGTDPSIAAGQVYELANSLVLIQGKLSWEGLSAVDGTTGSPGFKLQECVFGKGTGAVNQ
jgi:hypothetical protein